MQVWNEYDPIWYETEYISQAEVKILVTSELTKKLKKLNLNLTRDLLGQSCRNYIINLSIQKTIKDYQNISGELGYFQNNFKVYGREGLTCYKCKNLIIKVKNKGRSTFYCKICQK